LSKHTLGSVNKIQLQNSIWASIPSDIPQCTNTASKGRPAFPYTRLTLSLAETSMPKGHVWFRNGKKNGQHSSKGKIFRLKMPHNSSNQ